MGVHYGLDGLGSALARHGRHATGITVSGIATEPRSNTSTFPRRKRYSISEIVSQPRCRSQPYIEDAPGSWAGDRIICAGDYCKRIDPLPPGLLTEEEEKEWNTPLPTTGCRCEDMHKPDTLSQSLADFAVCRFTDENTPTEVRRKTHYHAMLDAMQRHFWRHDRRVLDAVSDKSGTPVYEEVEMEAPRILRNLSRKEYVHEDTLDQFMEDEEELMDEYGYGVCFAHIILMRICWSPRGGPALRDAMGKMHRGPWAGDRFDYTSAKDFRTVEKGDDG